MKEELLLLRLKQIALLGRGSFFYEDFMDSYAHGFT
jgi:hypothetical protein